MHSAAVNPNAWPLTANLSRVFAVAGTRLELSRSFHSSYPSGCAKCWPPLSSKSFECSGAFFKTSRLYGPAKLISPRGIKDTRTVKFRQ